MKTNIIQTILIILSWLIIFPTYSFGQSNDLTAQFEKQRRDSESLGAAANANPASRALHQRLISTRAEPESVEILQEAAKAGDRGIIPYLKARWENGLGPAQNLDIALVALGETQYVDKAFEDLRSKDAATRYWAVWRLARFKTKESWRKLHELLDDIASRDDGRGADDYIIMSMSWVTMEILRGAVADGPKAKDADDRDAWKAWFAKNKHLVE